MLNLILTAKCNASMQTTTDASKTAVNEQAVRDQQVLIGTDTADRSRTYERQNLKIVIISIDRIMAAE